MNNNIKKICASGALCFTLVACGTSQEARDMAKITAAHVKQAGKSVGEIETRRKGIAELRARAISKVQAHASLQETYVRERFFILKESGDSGAAATLQKLLKFSQEITKFDESRNVSADKFAKDILKERQTIGVDKEALNTAAEGLANLSRKESFWKRLGFLAAFSKDVSEKIDEMKKEADAAAAGAGEKIEDAVENNEERATADPSNCEG